MDFNDAAKIARVNAAALASLALAPAVPREVKVIIRNLTEWVSDGRDSRSGSHRPILR
ncbi:MAG: hypothetical protein ABWY02_00430 [Telluria sp.]